MKPMGIAARKIANNAPQTKTYTRNLKPESQQNYPQAQIFAPMRDVQRKELKFPE
jgi:hypothetical protein